MYTLIVIHNCRKIKKRRHIVCEDSITETKQKLRARVAIVLPTRVDGCGHWARVIRGTCTEVFPHEWWWSRAGRVFVAPIYNLCHRDTQTT